MDASAARLRATACRGSSRPPCALLCARSHSLARASLQRAPLLVAARRCTGGSSGFDSTKRVVGAVGSGTSRGTGQSLIGSRGRGARNLDALKSGAVRNESLPEHAGASAVDDELEAGDVLMEVLAEDHRRARFVEFGDAAADEPPPDEQEKPQLQLLKGTAAHRRFLTHRGVGEGTVYQRAAAAQKQRLEEATEAAFVYALPEEAKRAREDARRSRARRREHDVVESRIEEAMASGVFDDLPGAGKPLPVEENAFEAMSGEALAHRILKDAGCAPAWVHPARVGPAIS